MTDQELKDLVASLAVESKKTDEKLSSMGIHLAGISTNQGYVAEEYFINSLKSLPYIKISKYMPELQDLKYLAMQKQKH